LTTAQEFFGALGASGFRPTQVLMHPLDAKRLGLWKSGAHAAMQHRRRTGKRKRRRA